MEPTPGWRSPLPSVFITSSLHSRHAHIHTHTHLHKLGHMPSSWELAVLPGNQRAPIIAVYYSSHFPDSHIKQHFKSADPQGSSRHAHTDPLGLGVEVCAVAGSMNNQAETLLVVRKGCSMSQTWVATHQESYSCCCDTQAGSRGGGEENKKEKMMFETMLVIQSVSIHWVMWYL